MIDPETARHRKPFEEDFKTLGFTLMLVERREYLQKPRRAVEHVYCVFCFGSEIGPGAVPLWTELRDVRQRR